MLSLCASTQQGPKPHRILSVDVKRAYFYAPAKRPIYTELPVEDRLPGDEDNVAQLNLSLYGTRDAAQNWTQEYTKVLKAAGFTVGRASPCNFFHREADMALSVHGDDFIISGPERSLEWLQFCQGSHSGPRKPPGTGGACAEPQSPVDCEGCCVRG